MQHHFKKQLLTKEPVKVAGVGIGPANLSTAALLNKYQDITYAMFDTKPHFSWHAGMLLPKAKLQVSHLEDLVTLVDPTSPYSFIAFLAKNKRLYRFIYANFEKILRLEFNEYLTWVSSILPNLHFNETVQSINFTNNLFTVNTDKRQLFSQHLILGSGITPYIPHYAQKFIGKQVLHSSDYMHLDHNFAGKRIAVIGGGQSSAEIIEDIIDNAVALPAKLFWITKRNQFQQLDETAFVYELFSPAYTQYFQQLSSAARKKSLLENGLANHGISTSTIESIYQSLYKLELLDKKTKFFHLLPNHALINIEAATASDFNIFYQNKQLGSIFNDVVDIVIFATGYVRPFPHYLEGLKERISWQDNQYHVNADFTIDWDGPLSNQIYAQNAGQLNHGLADTNLCLLAWRSAKIINKIAGQSLYDLGDESITIDWRHKKEVSAYAITQSS